jgi:acetyl-CoA acetyltransferase family protein
MSDVYLFYAKRTPIGKIEGSLAMVRPDDLLAGLLKHFKKEHDFDLKEISEVITGCANQAGEDNRNISRMSLLLAGFPFEVPGMTINRLCASSLDGVIDAYARIKAGLGECMLVGGVESMSRAPWVISKAQSAFGRDQVMFDTSLGWRFPNAKMKELFPLYTMGETAEEVAKLYKISRQEQDEFAFASHQKAIQAQETNGFIDEIVPVEIVSKKGSSFVTTDEGPRKDTTLEKLASLKPVFAKDGSVTAGNSSSLNDGASLVGVATLDFIKRHKLKPLARITGAATAGLHPNVMGLGPIHAVKKLCKNFSKKTSDFDCVEFNEAFAIQALASVKDLEIDPTKVNIKGGAIALGHPLGSSGARILTTLIYNLQGDQKAKQGLASMCVGVGQGVALSIEKA